MLILVVDDDPIQCRSLQRWLTLDGHEVLTATTAEGARAHIDAHPDLALAIIDWNLGGALTGADVARYCRGTTATALLSGYSTQEMREGWQDPLRGILGVFGKPPNWDELREWIARVERSRESTPAR